MSSEEGGCHSYYSASAYNIIHTPNPHENRKIPAIKFPDEGRQNTRLPQTTVRGGGVCVRFFRIAGVGVFQFGLQFSGAGVCARRGDLVESAEGGDHPAAGICGLAR